MSNIEQRILNFELPSSHHLHLLSFSFILLSLENLFPIPLSLPALVLRLTQDKLRRSVEGCHCDPPQAEKQSAPYLSRLSFFSSPITFPKIIAEKSDEVINFVKHNSYEKC